MTKIDDDLLLSWMVTLKTMKYIFQKQKLFLKTHRSSKNLRNPTLYLKHKKYCGNSIDRNIYARIIRSTILNYQDPKSFMDAYNNMDRNNRGGGGYNDDRGQIMDLMDMRVEMGGGNMGNNRGNSVGSGGGGGGGGGGGRWQGGNDRNRQEDFPNKRRRY